MEDSKGSCMIFVSGMWIYILSMFFDSEDESIESLIELVGLAGVFLMVVSVSMFLWEKLP